MKENEVCVILLSYNRPRMLQEAIRSIKGADHMILVDDGSDFDVEAILKGCKPDAKEVTLQINPKLNNHAHRHVDSYTPNGVEVLRQGMLED